MHDETTSGKLSPERAADLPAFVPQIDMRRIFEEMIATEIRTGPLTPYRRRRIVRYAAQLGLSPVQAGRIITQCHASVLESDDPTHRRHALRLAESTAPRRRDGRVWFLVGLAILADAAIFYWLIQ